MSFVLTRNSGFNEPIPIQGVAPRAGLSMLPRFSPDISYSLGGNNPSSPFEANQFHRILKPFYDHGLIDR
jgi:hypothetical protein